MTDQVVGAAPPERAGAAAALSGTGGELGLALGVAIMGSIGAAVYRSDLDNALAPGLPAEAQEAARDTLGGAVAVAGQPPETAAAGFLDTAREAFTHGLQVTASISVLIAAVAAILVILVLRRVGLDAPSHGQPQDSSEDTGTPLTTDRQATIHSAAKLPWPVLQTRGDHDGRQRDQNPGNDMSHTARRSGGRATCSTFTRTDGPRCGC